MDAHLNFETLMVKSIKKFPLKGKDGEYLLVNLMGIKPQRNGSYFKLSVTVWPEEQRFFKNIEVGSIISGIAEMTTYPVADSVQSCFTLRSVWFTAGMSSLARDKEKRTEKPTTESKKEQDKLMEVANILSAHPFD